MESMFLENSQPNGDGGVMIPSAEADLILFIFRKFIEQPSIIEHYLFLKDFENIRKEFYWLIERTDRAHLRTLVTEYLPQIPVHLVDLCIDTLDSNSTVFRRVRLGLKVRKCFRNTVRDDWKASVMRTAMFVHAHLHARIGTRRKERYVFPGGMIIAFVGSEASGKSTLSKEIVSWLSSRFDVCHIHLGKPPKNWRTMPFWWVISKYVKLKAFVYPKAANRAATVGDEVSVAGSVDETNLPHPFICWLDTIDRRQWLMLHARKMMEGCIVSLTAILRRVLDLTQHASLRTVRSPAGSLTATANYRGLPLPDLSSGRLLRLMLRYAGMRYVILLSRKDLSGPGIYFRKRSNFQG